MSKKVTIVLSIIIFVLFCAGAGLAADKIKLDFPTWSLANPQYEAYWNAITAEFQSTHPNVEIDVYQVPYDGYINTMLARFTAEDPPDIFHIPTRDLYAFTGNDWLEPLEPVVGDAINDWMPIQQQWCVVDGHHISLLILGFGYILAYNDLLLKEAGVEVPENWSDLLVAATQISEKTGKYGVFMPTQDGDPNTYDITMSSVAIGLTGKNIVSDDGSFNNVAFKTAASYVKSLIETGALPTGVGNSMGIQMFIDGEVAFIIAGPWVPSGAIVKADPELRPHLNNITMLPSTKTNGVAGGVSNSFSIPKSISAEKKELAFDFIRLFATKKWQKEYGKILVMPPARLNVFTEEELKNEKHLSLFIDVTNYAINLVPKAFATKLGEYRDAVTEPFVSYLNGNPMGKSLKEAQNNTNSLLK